MSDIKIALVTDFEILKTGLKEVIKKLSSASIVLDCVSSDEFISKQANYLLDLVITDITLPTKNGITLATHLQKEVPVLAISYSDNFELFYQSIRSGVQGYLLRNTSEVELIDAIKAILKGDTYFSSRISKKLVNKLMEDVEELPAKPKVKLTKREKSILTLAMKGMKSKDIGESLGISIRTVDKHRANIMDKCKVNNIVALIQFVQKHKIL
jgi:DNA-binding NarL/FixJ family response regulator